MIYDSFLSSHIFDLRPACLATSSQAFFFMFFFLLFFFLQILQDLSHNTGKSLTVSTTFSSMPAMFVYRGSY